MKKHYSSITLPSILQMKPFIFMAGVAAALFLSSHGAMAQPVISGVFPNGSYQFQSTNELAFSATSTPGIANVSVTLTATNLFGVVGFPQTLTSSGGLTISGNANSEHVTAPLNTNMFYSVQIIVTDVNNASTTNNVSFDTISPAYTWEARDWDYTNGMFIDNPQTNAYAGLGSTANTDFYSGNFGSGSDNYRPFGLETESCSDTPRLPYSPYTTNVDYDVGYNNGGNWGNYTRHYPPGTYYVFVRASDGNGPQSNAGDIAVQNGTASFSVSGKDYFSVKPIQGTPAGPWQTYGWYPLINSTNGPAQLTIPNDGTAQTLRMTIDGGSCNENFFMLIPVNTNAPVVGEGFITNSFPDGTYQFQETNVFNCSVMSPNGVQSVVVAASGSYLGGGTFSQTLTPSSGLTISGPSTNENLSFALATNAIYSLTFLITDGNGNNSTTNLTFDTVYPNYYTWEAEDYDYSGGQFFDNPQTNAYYDLNGEANVDAYCPGGPTNANAYLRAAGPIAANDQGDLNIEQNGDVTRAQYNSGAIDPITLDPYVDYDVGFTAGGQWGNYTRTYPGGIYNIYVRAADGGGASTDAGTISLVTGGTPSQLGTFNVPSTGAWQKYAWCLVLNGGGYPARFEGSNGIPQTLRMTIANGSCNLNYYMLVPANLNNNPPPFVNNFTPDGTYLFQPSNTVNFTVNSSVGIATNNVVLYLNGVKQSNLTFSGNSFTYNVSCAIPTNTIYTAIIDLTDTAGSTSYTNSFNTFSAGDYQWEAEDYDFTSNGVSGQFFDNPQTNAYAGLGGASNIDLLESDLNAFSRASSTPYRPTNGMDFPDMGAGDQTRPQFSNGGTDYAIGSFGNHSWANYTRHYPAGVYNVIGRFAEGAGPASAALSMLTSGYGTSPQTTNQLGTFSIPDNGWGTWEWVPMLGGNGNLAQVTLNGSQTTLQLDGTSDNEANVNFLMLVPANTNVPSITGVSPGGGNLFEYSPTLSFTVTSPLGVASNSIVVTVNGIVVSNLVFSGSSMAWTVSSPGLPLNTSDTVSIQVTDTSGNVANATDTFNNYNPANYQWQASDYDFTSNGISGQFFDNPQTNAYANLGSTAGIDNYQSDLGANPFNYRADDAPGAAPATTPAGDAPRSQFASATAYNIGFFGAPSWTDYTRHYPLGTYNVLGRFACGATGGSLPSLSLVTSGYGTTNQTTSKLGSFSVQDDGWGTWQFVEMTGSVTFDGSQTTLQLEGGTPNEANVNFFMLIPTTPAPPLKASISGANIHLTFVTQTGYNYQVAYKTNLTDPSWTPLGSALAGDNAYQTVTDTHTASQHFYIVQIQSAP